MIVFQHGRADWVPPGPPVSGPPFNWAGIEWVVIHYTAAIDLPDGDMGEFAYDLPPYLRAVHREYLRRGYSIGYNAAVDWLGGDWELRGDTFKCAANADREDTIESPHDKGGDENARTFAILMLVDGQDSATPLAVDAVRRLVAQVRDHAPRAVIVLGHRDVDKTQCPGTGVYAQIRAGVFEPVDEPPPDPEPPPMPPASPTTKDNVMAYDGYIYAAKRKANGSWWVGDGRTRIHTGGKAGRLRAAAGVVDVTSEKLVHSFSSVADVDDATLDKYVGAWDGSTSEAE
jgi:hypothetical protein